MRLTAPQVITRSSLDDLYQYIFVTLVEFSNWSQTADHKSDAEQRLGVALTHRISHIIKAAQSLQRRNADFRNIIQALSDVQRNASMLADLPFERWTPPLLANLAGANERLERAVRAIPSSPLLEALYDSPVLGAGMAAIPQSPATKPVWDEETRCLYWKCQLVKAYKKHPAKNQVELLTAFAKAGWIATVPDPFRDSKKLNETIRALNKSLKGIIRIRGDGQGDGAVWGPGSP